MALDLDLSELHRLSLDEYHRLIEAGGFDEDARFELIDGLLVEMSPPGIEHEDSVAWLTEWLVLNVDRQRFQVRPGSPLTLERVRSEPQPDLTVIERDVTRPYHPATAALAIEVAVSSLRRDLRVKARLYGASGVWEYWVVDVQGGLVWVHRDPEPQGGYATVFSAGPERPLQARALALPPLDVGALLAAARGA